MTSISKAFSDPYSSDNVSHEAHARLVALYEFMEEHPDSAEIVGDVLLRKLHEAQVFAEKQADYGPGNIGRPPFGIEPEQALTVRLTDKIARIMHLTRTGVMDAQNEPLADSWLDIANYGTIGATVSAGQWPHLAPWSERHE